MSLEKRFLKLRSRISGYKEKGWFEWGYTVSEYEKSQIVPMTSWQKRIVSEIDFCLQLKKYSETVAEEPIDAALTVLEQAVQREGVLTDAVCEEAEQHLICFREEARSYRLLLVGHAHIDMNWQWSLDETVAITLATFRTMLRLLEEYPEFHFSQSQASVYQIVEEYAPELMPEIQKYIAEGRWEVTASSWVETDKNMPCLESLMNTIVYTKKYLKEHWGIDPDSLDLDFSPDTFGHSAFLPELDSLGGIKYYYHCRGFGEKDTILYRWKAPSGKELLMYQEPYWYNSGIMPAAAIGLPRMASMCGGLRTGMSVYGVGDHGGGPTRRDLNFALEMQKWPVFPEMQFAQMHDYFREAEKVREKLPVVEHELNPVFTGCYSSQSRIKNGNHRAEKALISAQNLSALVSNVIGGTYQEQAFEKAWQKTLFTHFHDILTGSCVQDTREHAMGLYQEVLSVANSRSVQALEVLTSAIDTSMFEEEEDVHSRSEGAGVGFGVRAGNLPTAENNGGVTRVMHIVNTTGVARHENVTLTVWDWPGHLTLLEVADAAGNPLPYEYTHEWHYYWAHRYLTVQAMVEVPAYGYTTVIVREKEPEEVTENYIYNNRLDFIHDPYEDIVLENQYLRAAFDRNTGAMYSLVDKTTGQERLKEEATAGLRYIRAQKVGMSSWWIGRYLDVQPLADIVDVKPIGGTLNPGVQTEYKVFNSKVMSTVTLGKEDKFLKIAIHTDWREDAQSKEEQPMLSYCLPLRDTTGQMLCDVPGGAIWRKEREQDVPCQHYGAAAMSDGRVLALASDSKYGFRLSKGSLYVTLLYTSNDPDPYPERSISDMTLYILPADADAAQLEKEMDVCLNPLQCVTNTVHGGCLPVTGSLLQTEGETAVFSSVAQREGCLAIRMYEAGGAECPVKVTVRTPVEKACLTDLCGRVLDIPVTVEDKDISCTLRPYMQAELRIYKMIH